jgi:hypothetical protein
MHYFSSLFWEIWEIVHFFGFIIRIYHDARSSECQNVMQAYVFSVYSKRATVLSFPSTLIW